MNFMLADSNALRNPGLAEFFASSRKNCIVLSDLTLIEMRKRNALKTSRESLLIASNYLNQVFVIKRTHDILKYNISSNKDVERLFDYSAGMELHSIARAVRKLPSPEWLTERMAELEKEAGQLIAELGSQMSDLEERLVEVTKQFDQGELRQLRTGKGVSDSTRTKLWILLKQTVEEFFVRNKISRGQVALRFSDAMGMFGFRYCLCMMIYYILWIQNGRQTGRERFRINDMIDMQLAALSTYFNGMLSTDNLAFNTSRAARAVLVKYGAFVGDDWLFQGR